MLRNILAVIVGFVVASAVMTCVEIANRYVFYPEFGEFVESKDKEFVREFEASHPGESAFGNREVALRRREMVREIMPGAPLGMLLVVVIGWVLGSFAGGFVTTWIGRQSSLSRTLVLGGLLTLAGILNNLMLPPPVWFWILSLIGFLPATYLGARLAPKKTVVATAAAGATA